MASVSEDKESDIFLLADRLSIPFFHPVTRLTTSTMDILFITREIPGNGCQAGY